MLRKNIIRVQVIVYSPVELYILQPKYDGFSTFKVEKEKDPSLGSFLGQLLPLAMPNLPGGGLQPIFRHHKNLIELGTKKKFQLPHKLSLSWSAEMRRNPAEQLHVMHWFNKTGSSQQPAPGSKKSYCYYWHHNVFQILSIWETTLLHQRHMLPWLHMLSVWNLLSTYWKFAQIRK